MLSCPLRNCSRLSCGRIYHIPTLLVWPFSVVNKVIGLATISKNRDYDSRIDKERQENGTGGSVQVAGLFGPWDNIPVLQAKLSSMLRRDASKVFCPAGTNCIS